MRLNSTSALYYCLPFLLEILFTSPINAFQNSDIRIIKPLTERCLATPHFIPHKRIKRPRVGLALSGGGARCISQIGAMQVLLENDIPIDAIVGTSMGSIIGGFYAIGYSPWEIASLVKEIDWNSILSDKPPRQNLFMGQKQLRDRHLFRVRFDGIRPHIPPAFSPGQKIQSLLTKYTMQANSLASASFDNFRVPFRAVCTDLYSGKKIVLSSGDLAEAMRASLAFPLLFTAVPYENMMLVDGGMIDNIPVDDVKNFSIDIVIALDASSELRKPGQISAPWEIADQVTSIMQREKNQASRQKADVLIRLDDPDRTSMDFTNLDSLILLGRNAMTKMLPQIVQKMQASQRLINRKILAKLPDSLSNVSLNSVTGVNQFSFGKRDDGRAVKTATSSDVLNAFEDLAAQNIYNSIYAEVDSNKNVKIRAEINPILKNVSFRGNTAVSSDSLALFFKGMLGKPLHFDKSDRALKSIIKAYRKRGFSLATISEIIFSRDTGLAHIHIDEGIVSRIEIEGNKRTKGYVIQREFPPGKGDIFNSNRAQKGISNIFGTGLFNRVSLSLKKDTSGAAIHIKTEEKKYTSVGVASRFDSERKAKVLVEITDENILGIGANFSLNTTLGNMEKGIRSRFSLERIFQTYFTLNAEAAFSSTFYYDYKQSSKTAPDGYTQQTVSTFLGIGQLVKRFGHVSFEFHIDRYHLKSETGVRYRNQHFNINRLVFKSILDTRDKLPFPMNGRYVTVFYDVSSKLINPQIFSKVSFFRTLGQIETYSTLHNKHTFISRFGIGSADLTTPFALQFRIGGENAMFGLRDREWVGRHFVLANLGYRIRLQNIFPFDLHWGLRYDAGGIWSNIEKAKYGELNHAIGTSLGIDTFLGGLRVSWGRIDTGRSRIYFSLGNNF